jgi:hypothetical protein
MLPPYFATIVIYDRKTHNTGRKCYQISQILTQY